MKIINLTDHPVRLRPGDNGREAGIIYLPTSGRARLVSNTTIVGNVELRGVGIPMIEYRDRKVLDLPDQVDDQIYVVSGVVCDAVQRADVWTVGGKVVGRNGKVIAGRYLARWIRT